MANEDKLPVAAGEALAKASIAVFVPYGGAAVVAWEAVQTGWQRESSGRAKRLLMPSVWIGSRRA
jgi:hypothetical protein